jgi:hypothetical protein
LNTPPPPRFGLPSKLPACSITPEYPGTPGLCSGTIFGHLKVRHNP